MANKKTILHLVSCYGNNAVSKVIKGVVKNLDDSQFESIICTTYAAKETYQDSGLRIENLQMRNFFDLPMALKLVKIIRKNNVDIVNCHNIRAFFYGGLISKLMGRKTVFTYHTVYQDYYRKDYNKMIAFIAVNTNKILSLLSDVIVAVSANVAEYVKKTEKIPSYKIVVIHNGIEIAIEEDKASELFSGIDVGENTKLIANIAELNPRKGQIYLIEAAAEIIKSYPEVRFLIVGDGPLLGVLKAKVQELKLTRHVIFTGFRNDVNKILNDVDIFVLPSLNEGCPLALLEAMSFGVPSIATRVAGIPEIIKNDNSGLIVEPADKESLSAAVIKLLNNSKMASIMGREGKRIVMENFTAAKMSDLYAEIYYKLFEK